MEMDFNPLAMAQLKADVRKIQDLLAGMRKTHVRMPSGLSGINHTYNVIGSQLGSESAESSGDFSHPFKLTAFTDGATRKFRVSSASSSITDGTNGTAITTISDIDTDITITAEKYIVVEADVAADLTLSNWTVKQVGAEDAAEVKFETVSSVYRQTKARLLIGKITIGINPTSATAWQAWFTSARITTGILSGIAVRVFEAAPTHPTKI